MDRERAFDPSIRAHATRPASWPVRVANAVRDFFVGDEITLEVVVIPLWFVALVLFTRHPLKTNFIFDEQEALLANPYVRSVADPNSHIRWIDAFNRDFWGLTSDRSIGSYRPLPDLVWRALWAIGARDQTPFFHHVVNVFIHGLNAAILALIVQRVTRDRLTAWLAGALFVSSAILTEAVSGVVGIADVLGGLGALLAVASLALPMHTMPIALFVATLLGLYSKESALCIVPLVPLAALIASPLTHPKNPRRLARAALAALATVAAFVLYVEARKRMFHPRLPHELSEEVLASRGMAARIFGRILRWYAQPEIPHDPLNNPLFGAPVAYRIAGAARVYFRGLLQVLFPWRLSGDYSAPEEPVPDRLFFPESVLGAALTIVPLGLAAWLAIRSWREERARLREEAANAPLDARVATLKSREHAPPDVRLVIAVALLWIVISYFPVSNVPVVLPTVRAERFWYFPALATSVLLALAFTRVVRRRFLAWIGWPAFLLFFSFQAFAARRHANDYTDDLVFWDATRHSVPRSAKAHLNYSVMLGARGDLEGRAAANRVALELAPDWAMANVYLGDTLCRLHRPREAWPHYARGFELAPQDANLIALGLQCLWDEHALGDASGVRGELVDLADRHPGSWLEYLAHDTVDYGAQHNGVDPKYRPRGYNEGPKGD